MPIGLGTGAAIAGGGALLGGIFGAGSSKKAASTQADANKYAAQLAYQMYQQTAQRLQPWVDTGGAATKALGGFLGLPGYGGGVGGFAPGAGVQPFQPTMAQLEQTPGYQFTKQQGLQATENAAAPMGGGGSLLKGIDAFTTGLASTTYQQQFSNYWAQLGQVYNMLSGVSGTGENAAAMTGQAGTGAAASAGNFLSAAGANQAAGTIGAASAGINALSGASSLPLQLALINQVGQFGGGGSGAGGGGPGGSFFLTPGVPSPPVNMPLQTS